MTDTPHRPDQGPSAATDADPVRLFLVVVDDSEEMPLALHYACRRARATGGRVGLLYVLDLPQMQHWAGVAQLMQEELRGEAEALLQRASHEVQLLTGRMPGIFLRQGSRLDELLKLIETDPTISILVLAASTKREGPGPLITALTGRSLSRVHIPITIVPGVMTRAEIDKIT